MNLRAKAKRWLHYRGIHRWCVPVVKHDYSRQYIQTTEGDIIDVTSFSGTTRVVAHR